MDALALTGAISGAIGAATGATALGFQIHANRVAGHDVRVTASSGFPVYNSSAYGEQHLGDHMLIVTAFNRGRSPVDLTSWGLAGPGDSSLVDTRPLAFTTRLPHRLEPGSEASFYMEAEAIRAAVADRRWSFDQLTAYVLLADGTRRKAKPGIPLA